MSQVCSFSSGKTLFGLRDRWIHYSGYQGSYNLFRKALSSYLGRFYYSIIQLIHILIQRLIFISKCPVLSALAERDKLCTIQL